MASNLQLTELEQRVLDYVKQHPGNPENVIIASMQWQVHPKLIRQAISDLVQKSFISADENLRYVAIGGEL